MTRLRRAGAQAVEAVAAAVYLPAMALAWLAGLLASRAWMPGVTVRTQARPGPSRLLRAPSSTYFVVGLTERGPTGMDKDANLVRNLQEFRSKFGDRTPYSPLYDDLDTFFSEGGARAYVKRLAGPAATTGFLNLADRAAGAGLSTVKVSAASVGSWSSRLSLVVADGAVPNTFSVTVLLDGQPVELYANQATPAAFVAEVTRRRSPYIVAEDLASVTPPGLVGANNPRVVAASALSAGTDDRAALTGASYIAGLASFGPHLGAGIVAIPGQDASIVGAGLIAHAVSVHDRRLVILTPPKGQTVAQARALEVGFRGVVGSEYAGFFYPWTVTPDGAGGRRTTDPAGYVAGVRARTHNELPGGGPWEAPAGEKATARHVIDVEHVEGGLVDGDEATINALNADGVSVITRFDEAGVQLYGWRSLSTDEVNYRLLTARDTMNHVATEGKRLLQSFVFGKVDSKGRFFSRLHSTIKGDLLEPIARADGLYSRNDDGGYTIDAVGPNTEDVLARDEVIVAVSIRVSPTAEQITMLLTKVAFASAL